MQRKERLNTGRLERRDGDPMPLARPIIGEETSNAFRTSRAKIGNEEDNVQGLLAAKEPKPNLDRLVSFMGACALARFEREAPLKVAVSTWSPFSRRLPQPFHPRLAWSAHAILEGHRPAPIEGVDAR